MMSYHDDYKPPKKKAYISKGEFEHDRISGRTTSPEYNIKDDPDRSPELRPSFSGISSMNNITGVKPEDSLQSLKVQRMMANMGYSGGGLGLKEQGRLAPVEASMQEGRRGLGHKVQSSASEPSVVWRPELDDVRCDQDCDFHWLRGSIGGDADEEMFPMDLLNKWAVIGQRKLSIDNETKFCTPSVLKNVLDCKTVFDTIDGRKMLDARTRSNPFEVIKSGIFMNRAAMKMANMDFITDFIFTRCVPEDNILYFADICAGPGGFTEYMLWRRPISSRGFGFTLRGQNDFKMNDILAGPMECFTPYYGPDDDGDIFKEDNLMGFQEFVMERTGAQNGVNVVMADGGFSVEGQENIQEILSKQLYLCQFYCAISVLCEGGHFVCKLFDIFTSFSVGLIYLVSKVFKEFAIIKPVTSRPANSERYVVFRSLVKDKTFEIIKEHLFFVNSLINDQKDSDQDIVQLVPYNILENDEEFFRYIYESNDKLGTNQALALSKIRAYATDRNLLDLRQGTIKDECLKKWMVPVIARLHLPRPLWSDNKLAAKIVGDNERRSLSTLDSSAHRKIDILTRDRFMKESFVLRNHSGFVIGDGDCMFIYSKGGSDVFYWKDEKRWESIRSLYMGLDIYLPASTLLWGSHTLEYCPPKGQRKVHVFHILDAVCIYGKDLRDQYFHQRRHEIKKLIDSLKEPTATCVLRLPEEIELQDLEQFHDNLQLRPTKAHKEALPMYVNPEDQRFFYPINLVIICHIQEPWMIAFSRSNRRVYYYNAQTRESIFEMPASAIAPFSKCPVYMIPWKRPPALVNEPVMQNTHIDLLEWLAQKQ